MVIITGSSSGIGYACVRYFLEKGEKVIGISRTNQLNHKRFTFIPCDFSKIEALKKLDLEALVRNEKDITVINNAGIIGPIERLPELNLERLHEVAMVNIVALQHISAQVIKFAKNDVRAIVNISSGAGRRPIPSWSAYCASKAAVDLFSETIKEDLVELGYSTLVYSLAPGVVNTNMQKEIRNSDGEVFSGKQNFVDLKENDELRSPKEVAELLGALLEQPQQQEIITRL